MPGYVIVGYGELAVAFVPDGDSVILRTGAAAEKLDFHIVLAVREARIQRVHKGVVRQVGGFGGDARQRRNDLVFHYIVSRCRSGMGEAVSDGIGAAVLAGVGESFAHGLFQRRDAGQVLGVHGNVIDPAFAAVIGVAPVHSCHGQGEKKRRSGFCDISGTFVSTRRYSPRGRSLAEVWP